MFDDLPKIKGIVVAIKANYAIVEIDIHDSKSFVDRELRSLSNTRLLCNSRKRLTHLGYSINVGDRVVVESIDWNLKRAIICKLDCRKSFLSRPPVANVTDIIIVLSAKDPAFDFDQASRFLLAAEQTRLNISLLLNKVDLISSEENCSQIKRLQSWGYFPLPVSVRNGYGMDHLLSQIKQMPLSVFCGPSGVGKSSLLKFFLPKESIEIGDLSVKLKRGKNTTRHVQLYSLAKGSLIADTPGFNRPDLNIDPVGLQALFPEISSQLKEFSCKFRDCLHLDEPDCIVDKSWERYQQYRQIVEKMITSI